VGRAGQPAAAGRGRCPPGRLRAGAPLVLLADTNIWLAAADRRSDRHRDCAGLVREHRGELAAPVPVIAEASWLILDRLGAPPQAAFLRLVTSGQLAVVDLTRGGLAAVRGPGRAVREPAAGPDRRVAGRRGRAAEPHHPGDAEPPGLRRGPAPSHGRVHPPARLTRPRASPAFGERVPGLCSRRRTRSRQREQGASPLTAAMVTR
jgi:hypothetical protein